MEKPDGRGSVKVGVVIPVGPGHEALADRAELSVRAAWLEGSGPFRELTVTRVPDPDGDLGRSRARNIGLDSTPADFHFLLDADDEMMPDAFYHVDLGASATFGALHLAGRRRTKNVYPVDRGVLLRRGPFGTLSMGCFVRGDLGLRFDESLDAGEDFDFYLRLPDFTKRVEPLVRIGCDQPSAGGPRGYEELDWRGVCHDVICRHRGTLR